MNKPKQFWTLLKFLTTINPTIWIMPLAFGVPFYLPLLTSSISKTYHPGFMDLFMNQNLFFVVMFGSIVLAPERFQFGASTLTASYSGTEFILTRAIDRPVLYRAKAAALYFLVLLLPCLAIATALNNPDLIVSEYSKTVQQECLAQVSGSVLLPAPKNRQPSLISIPRGNILVAEWQLGVYLITALLLQVLILILYPFKYARFAFWALFFGLIFIPVLYDIYGPSNFSTNAHLFFAFAAHQVLFWIIFAAAFVLAQLWCERRFDRLEQ